MSCFISYLLVFSLYISSPPIFQLCCCHLCSPLALWRIRKSSSVYWTTSTQLVFHNCRSMFLSHSFFVSSLSLSFPLLCLTLSLPLFINSGLQIAAEWINDPLALYCVRWCLWVFVCMHVWMPSLVRHWEFMWELILVWADNSYPFHVHTHRDVHTESVKELGWQDGTQLVITSNFSSRWNFSLYFGNSLAHLVNMGILPLS